MRKLIKGIVEFRKTQLSSYREKFAKLALGQSPDTLFIACSDSRVVPNAFASTNPGDLFVVRNVGNLVPAYQKEGSEEDRSEAAAIEFAVSNLSITDIVVCGHSECGAMMVLVEGRDKVASPHLKSWLRHGERKGPPPKLGGELSRHNWYSQANVLEQLDHLRSYPLVRDRIAQRRLRLHAWWFELSRADVHCYDEAAGKFIVIEEDVAQKLLKGL